MKAINLTFRRGPTRGADKIQGDNPTGTLVALRVHLDWNAKVAARADLVADELARYRAELETEKNKILRRIASIENGGW